MTPQPTLFDPILDRPRKSRISQKLKMLRAMQLVPEKWWTLRMLSEISGASEAGASARLRELNNVDGYPHEIRRVRGNLNEYRLLRRYRSGE